MIESISIKNFQKHEQFELSFDTITTLCGPSDRGKSAIVRALRWLCFNKPDGDSFIRHGEKDCQVVLSVDRHKIKRTKGSTGNEYFYDDKRFNAFGRDVPQEIQKLLNLADDSFQSQHDPAYWLTLSSGQAAKELNKVINLELIDKCQANISSELRKAKTTVEVSKSRLEGARKEVGALDWVRDANESFRVIKAKSEVINDRLIKLNRMRQIQGEGAKHQRVLQNANQAKPDAFLGKLNKLLDLKSKLTRLNNLNKWITTAKEESCQKNMSWSQAKQGFQKALTNQLCPICQQPLPAS